MFQKKEKHLYIHPVLYFLCLVSVIHILPEILYPRSRRQCQAPLIPLLLPGVALLLRANLQERNEIYILEGGVRVCGDAVSF